MVRIPENINASNNLLFRQMCFSLRVYAVFYHCPSLSPCCSVSINYGNRLKSFLQFSVATVSFLWMTLRSVRFHHQMAASFIFQVHDQMPLPVQLVGVSRI
jgi:hypothetical protein